MTVGSRILLYGPEATGKTTLASKAAAPIFFDIEGSTNQLKGDISRYTWRDEKGGHVPQTYEEILAGIKEVLEEKHDYKTLVIDGIDRLEGMLWDYILARDSKRKTHANDKGRELISVEDYGWGKGYAVALDEWRLFLRRLERLTTKRCMDVVLVGHSNIRLYKNPTGEDYERYQLRLKDSAAGNAAGLVKEWSDEVGFVSFEGGGVKHADNERTKGYTTGRRMIAFLYSGAYDAKTRKGYPDRVPVDEFKWEIK